MFDTLSSNFTQAIKSITGQSKISESNIEETLKEVRKALLEADVNFKVAKDFVHNVKEKALGEKVLKGVKPGEQFVQILHEELTSLMGDVNNTLKWEEHDSKAQGPLVLLMVGPNGVGKTTFCGKLAYYLKNKLKKSVYLVPADTYRPAAKDQLLTHAKNIGVDYFDSDLSIDPDEITLQSLSKAKELNKDVVIIDTAGRLQVNTELMGQLRHIKSNVQSYSHEVLLVADAMTGQEAVNVAKTFHEQIKLTGVILSKMDSDARGGAALSIRSVVDVPIRFIGTGEKMPDLEVFHPDRMAQRILDMGDILTLVEKAKDVIDETKSKKTFENLLQNKFTIDDFIQQLESLKKMGPITSVLKMLPGMGSMMKNMGDIGAAEGELQSMRIIISSMTKQERLNDHLINDSRKKRIAMGSGTTVAQVNDFLNKFKQVRSMMINFTSMLPNMAGKAGMDMPFGIPGAGANQPTKKKSHGRWGKGFF